MNPPPEGVALLKEKLDDPHTSAVLARLIDRLDSLESSVARLTDMLEQAPAMAATVGDMVDEAVRNASSHGVDVDERLRSSLGLLERLTDPAMVRSLNRLMDLAENSEGAIAMVGDMVDDAAQRLDLDDRARSGAALLERATRPGAVDQLGEMFDILLEAEYGMLSPGAVRSLGVAGQALAAAREEPPQRATLFQALRAARDPEVQRALGFLLQFGRQFAKRLDT